MKQRVSAKTLFARLDADHKPVYSSTDEKIVFLNAMLQGAEILNITADSILLAQSRRVARYEPYIFSISFDINSVDCRCLK